MSCTERLSSDGHSDINAWQSYAWNDQLKNGTGKPIQHKTEYFTARSYELVINTRHGSDEGSQKHVFTYFIILVRENHKDTKIYHSDKKAQEVHGAEKGNHILLY